MRSVLSSVCCGLFLLAGSIPFVAAEVSPRADVRENVQQLLETKSCPGCDLTGAVLHRAQLAGANLEAANLAGAKLNLADLAGANLKYAILQGASLGGTDLGGADLTGANLTGAVLEGAYLEGAIMDGRVVTRNPNAEDGGPVVEETVFEGAEGSSKDVPFTNKPVISAPKAVEKETPATAVAADMAKSPPSGQTGSLEQGAAAMEKDPLPAASKQLKSMDEAVISGPMRPRPGEHNVSSKSIHDRDLAVRSSEPAEVMTEPAAPARGISREPQAEDEPTTEAAQPAAEIPPSRVKQPEAESGKDAAPARNAAQPVEETVEEKAAGRMAAARETEGGSEEMAEVPREPAVDPEAEKKKQLVEKLLDDNRCIACDLSGVDLSDEDLEEADLERVNLSGANLREVDLEDANLKGADLSGANLREADLREADLYRANLSGADLTGAKLEGALIDSMISTGVIGADFSEAITGK